MSSVDGSLPYNLSRAAEKFDAAQRRAFMQHVLALLTGRSDELLSFDEVRHLLRARQQRDEGTRMIAVDHIVGSEGCFAPALPAPDQEEGPSGEEAGETE